MKSETRRPLIFDIHRYALDDGPGIRTTVFFKGCPLACRWCHNPEGMHPQPQVYYLAEKCIACGDCVSTCPHQAIAMGTALEIDRSRCDACGQCAQQCPTTALTIKGKYYPANELLDRLMKDKGFFDHSGGGVTFSGGEPTLYPDYLKPVLCALKERGVHIAVQTCGAFDWDRCENDLLPWIDLIYFDIKGMDGDTHRQWTGRSNRPILTNFLKLAELAPEKLICTIPLIAGWTAEQDNLEQIAHFLGTWPDLPYRLHPYHPGGRFKAEALGQAPANDLPRHAMTPVRHHGLVEAFDAIVNRRRNRHL